MSYYRLLPFYRLLYPEYYNPKVCRLPYNIPVVSAVAVFQKGNFIIIYRNALLKCRLRYLNGSHCDNGNAVDIFTIDTKQFIAGAGRVGG